MKYLFSLLVHMIQHVCYILPMYFLQRLHSFLQQFIYWNLFFFVFLYLLYRFNILHRAIHRFLESELTKIFNGATVTIANVQLHHLWTSFTSNTLIVTDCILHTPQREEWQWDSPLIARIGRIHVTLNVFSLLKLPDWMSVQSSATSSRQKAPSEDNADLSSTKSFFSFITNIPVRDIYTVQMEDVQVFVEKRRNVFNFHLLDESLDIPNPKDVMESCWNLKGTNPISPRTNADFQSSSSSSMSLSESFHVPTNTSKTALHSKSSTSFSNHPSANNFNVEDVSPVKKILSPSHISSPLQEDRYPSGRADSNVMVPSTVNTTTGTINGTNPTISSLDTTTSAAANEIFTHMMDAVSNIRQAVHEGKGITNAIQDQKKGFVNQLKHFLTVNTNETPSNRTSDSLTWESSQDPSHGNGSTTTSATTTMTMKNTNAATFRAMNATKRMGDIAKEGMKVIQQVGKDMKEVVDSLSKPPPKKAGWNKINPDLFRVGRIVFKDVRVFTKDVILLRSSSSMSATTMTATSSNHPTNETRPVPSLSGSAQASHNVQHTAPSEKGKPQPKIDTSGWSKPIYLKEVIVTSSDLCPSSKALDKDGYPAIGQRIDVIVDLLIKILAAEMAKTNTGRLFNNALGEVFAVLDTKRSIMNTTKI